MKYHKLISSDEEDATHYSDADGRVRPIKDKIIELSSFIGRKDYLFDFSDDKETWYTGPLFGRSYYGGRFVMGKIVNSHVEYYRKFTHIQFHRKEYYHSGCRCPWPHGVMYHAFLGTPNSDGTISFKCFSHEQMKQKYWKNKILSGQSCSKYSVEGSEPIGLLPGWKYGWHR